MPKKLKKAAEKTKVLGDEGAERVKKTKIRIIGIGGGGGNIVSEIALKIKKASFVAANTDFKALKQVARNVERFQFGQNFTHGLGTGMNPELGELASQNEKDRIKKLLQGFDLVILIASLGGGTGSGAAPIFAQISRSLGNLTLGIFTLPFKFEGEKKVEIARSSLEKTRTKLNAFSVIPNERVFQIVDKQTPLKQALSTINKSLAESLEGLIEMIYEPGLINIDFADLKTILEGRGRLAYLNTVWIPKREAADKEIIEKLLNNPLYPYIIKGAKGVLLNIAGEKELSLSEVSQISKTISNLLNKEAKIIFGISQGKKYAGIIKTTLLATGCAIKILSILPSRTSSSHKKAKPKKKPSIIKKRPKKRRAKKNTAPRVKLKIKKAKKLKIVEAPSSNKKMKTGGKPKKLTSAPKPNMETKKPEEKETNEPETKKEAVLASNPPAEPKVRKNALQIKKETEEEEEKMLAEEEFWETPAFLRKNKPFTV